MKTITKPVYKPHEIEFIKLHFETRGAKYCAQQLNRTIRGISGRAHRMGLKVNMDNISAIQSFSKIKAPEMYLVNPEPFMNIIKPEIAYILGFVWADGYVHNKTPSIVIKINQKDAPDIESILSKTGQWNKYQYDGRDKESVIFTTSNRILHDFLVDNDYRDKSASPEKILSKIPEHLKCYWYRGFFDGDGHISFRGKSTTFVIAGPFEQDWKFMFDLCEKLQIRCQSKQKIDKTRTQRHSIFYSYRSKIAKVLLDYLYQNTSDSLCLTRKYKTYQLVKEYVI